jgi:hypothetical protein
VATWSVPLQKLADKAKVDLETVVRKVTIGLFSNVLVRTPVDTGRARGNWNLSYNGIDDSTSANTDPSGERKLAEIKTAVLAAPVGGVMYMCNSLPYARVLEYGEYPNPTLHGSKKRGEKVMTIHTVNGYSKQAPYGMVRITAREIVNEVRRAVRS